MLANHRKRLLTIFLAAASISLSTQNLFAQQVVDRDTMRALAPAVCMANAIDCTCYGPKALSEISKGLTETQLLKYQIDAYKQLQTKVEKDPWYSEPSFVVGGVVVGVLTGGLIGYLLAR